MFDKNDLDYGACSLYHVSVNINVKCDRVQDLQRSDYPGDVSEMYECVSYELQLLS